MRIGWTGWIGVALVVAPLGACTRPNPIFGDDDGSGKTSATAASDSTVGVADTNPATSHGTAAVDGTGASTGAPSSTGGLDGPQLTTGPRETTGPGEGSASSTGAADGFDAPEPFDVPMPFDPCCTAQVGGGCGDVLIEDCVCAADPECCTVAYQMDCAALAVVECGLGGCVPPLGDCCVDGLQAGCESWNTMFCVCFTHGAPECCNGVWDADCAYLAVNACAAAC